MDNLPQDIFYELTKYLTFEDISALSVVCSHYREGVKHALFHSIGISWQQMALPDRAEWEPLAPYAKLLVVRDIDRHGEWHTSSNIPLICSLLPHLQALMFSFSGTSRWLKHVPANPIKELICVSTNCNVNLFDACDLAPFHSLASLKLNGFNLCVSDPDNKPTLQKLHLTDCTWNYPNYVSDFADMHSLVVHYTAGSSFLLSERFRELIEAPPQLLQEMAVTVPSGSLPSGIVPLSKASSSNVPRLVLGGFERAKRSELHLQIFIGEPPHNTRRVRRRLDDTSSLLLEDRVAA